MAAGRVVAAEGSMEPDREDIMVDKIFFVCLFNWLRGTGGRERETYLRNPELVDEVVQ